MSKPRLNQKGFSHVEVGILVVVVLAIALVGYMVMQKSSTKTLAPSTSSTMSKSSPTTQTASAPTKAQLQQAATSLDNTNVDSIDLSQLDSDLNSML